MEGLHGNVHGFLRKYCISQATTVKLFSKNGAIVKLFSKSGTTVKLASKSGFVWGI